MFLMTLQQIHNYRSDVNWFCWSNALSLFLQPVGADTEIACEIGMSETHLKRFRSMANVNTAAPLEIKHNDAKIVQSQ